MGEIPKRPKIGTELEDKLDDELDNELDELAVCSQLNDLENGNIKQGEDS